MAMTDKKRQFIKARKMGMNQTEAAVFAGYSEKTAEVQGSRLMRDPDVAKHLVDVKDGVKSDVKVDEVLETDVTPTPQDVKKAARLYSDPLEKLLDLMNCGDQKTEFEAAKVLMPFVHGKIGEKGKKENQKDEAAALAAGKFGAMRPPTRKFNS